MNFTRKRLSEKIYRKLVNTTTSKYKEPENELSKAIVIVSNYGGEAGESGEAGHPRAGGDLM